MTEGAAAISPSPSPGCRPGCRPRRRRSPTRARRCEGRRVRARAPSWWRPGRSRRSPTRTARRRRRPDLRRVDVERARATGRTRARDGDRDPRAGEHCKRPNARWGRCLLLDPLACDEHLVAVGAERQSLRLAALDGREDGDRRAADCALAAGVVERNGYARRQDGDPHRVDREHLAARAGLCRVVAYRDVDGDPGDRSRPRGERPRRCLHRAAGPGPPGGRRRPSRGRCSSAGRRTACARSLADRDPYPGEAAAACRHGQRPVGHSPCLPRAAAGRGTLGRGGVRAGRGGARRACAVREVERLHGAVDVGVRRAGEIAPEGHRPAPRAGRCTATQDARIAIPRRSVAPVMSGRAADMP